MPVPKVGLPEAEPHRQDHIGRKPLLLFPCLFPVRQTAFVEHVRGRHHAPVNDDSLAQWDGEDFEGQGRGNGQCGSEKHVELDWPTRRRRARTRVALLTRDRGGQDIASSAKTAIYRGHGGRFSNRGSEGALSPLSSLSPYQPN